MYEMDKMNYFTLVDRIFALNPFLKPPDKGQAEGMFTIWKMLSETNEKMNLTAITEESAVILRHFVDSLTVSGHIPQNSKVIDVGCGAEPFPASCALPPRPEITAIDSTAKK